MKKSFLYLTTLGAFILPIATIVSCASANSSEKDKKEKYAKPLLVEKSLSREEDVRKHFTGNFIISSPVENLSKVENLDFFTHPKSKSYGEDSLLNLNVNEKNDIKKVYDAFYQNTIPLAKTKFVQKEKNSNQKDEHRFSPIYSFSNNSKNPIKVNTVSSDQKSNMLFSMWSYIDQIIDWNKKARFTIPKPEDISIAHLNGKKIIGTCFFPWGNNPGIYKKLLQKDENGKYVVADAMIKVANDLGFDGWFFNLEAFNQEETEKQGNIGDKFKLKNEIKELELQIAKLSPNTNEYDEKLRILEEKRKKFHIFNIPKDVKKEIAEFFDYIYDQRGDLDINLYQYGIGEKLFDRKEFDNFFVDFQLRNTWKNKTKDESDEVKNKIWYGYYFGKYSFDMKNDKDDKWHPKNDYLDFSDYNNWWTFDFLNTDYPSEAKDLRFFSGYKGEDKNWTPANKWFLETTTIIDAKKPFSSGFSLGLGNDFRIFGKKNEFSYRNAAIQDILPTYRYLNYFYDEKNNIIKKQKHNEELIQEIKSGSKSAIPYFGNNVLKYAYDLKKDEFKMVNKLFASNMDLKAGAKFRIVYRNNNREEAIIPKLALWYDPNDSEKFIELESSTKDKFIKNAKQYNAWYRELEFEITQDVLNEIAGLDKKLYSFGVSFEKSPDRKRITTTIPFFEYIPPNYQTPSKKTLQLEEVNTIWTKNILTKQNISISTKFDKEALLQSDIDPQNVRSSALTLKFKNYKPGQVKMNVFYSSKQEKGFEKDKIIGISNNNAVVIDSLPINKNIPIIVESYDSNHKLIGENNFILRTPF